MCCFITTFLFFGPRLAFFVYWLFPLGGQVYMNTAIGA